MEAGLTALLVLAGVDPGDAVLATFAYRLFSYWLPLPFGLLGMALATTTCPTTAITGVTFGQLRRRRRKQVLLSHGLHGLA